MCENPSEYNRKHAHVMGIVAATRRNAGRVEPSGVLSAPWRLWGRTTNAPRNRSMRADCPDGIGVAAWGLCVIS